MFGPKSKVSQGDTGVKCKCRGRGVPEFIDPCIRDLVECLNRHGIQTIGSCCGHGVGKGRILIPRSAIQDHSNDIVALRTSKKSILMPYDLDKNRWLEWEDYPGDSADWYKKQPYKKGVENV